MKMRHRRVRRGRHRPKCRRIASCPSRRRRDRRPALRAVVRLRGCSPPSAGDGATLHSSRLEAARRYARGERAEPHRRPRRRRPARDRRRGKDLVRSPAGACANSASEDEALRLRGSACSRSGCSIRSSRGIVREFAEGSRRSSSSRRSARSSRCSLREVLYGRPTGRASSASSTRPGNPLVPSHGELDAGLDRAARRRRDSPRVRCPSRCAARMGDARRASPRVPATRLPWRAPPSSAGLPAQHARTVVPEGSMVGGGIGCHTMAMLMDRSVGSSASPRWAARARSGSAWRRSPRRRTCSRTSVTARFFHSGMLAIKAAVAAGREHHLQDALQLRGRDDGRAAGRRARCRCPRWRTSCSRKASEVAVVIRRAREVRRRAMLGGADVCTIATRSTRCSAAARGRRASPCCVRPGMRGREAPAAQARASASIRRMRVVHQRARCARAAATAA